MFVRNRSSVRGRVCVCEKQKQCERLCVCVCEKQKQCERLCVCLGETEAV